VPQVHGATRDVIDHVREIVYREANSVTDNPLFFFDDDNENFDVLSGGNFHGQHLALALDYLAMATAELANISERRIELLLNPAHSNGLPAFLTPNEGLNSGYMMLHVTASALVNENKVQCHPASVDSIPTSAGREDHVSMGMTSANKLWRVIKNTKTVLAIELLAAHQALDLRPVPCAGIGSQQLHLALRKIVPMRKGDCYYKKDLDELFSWLSLSETTNLIRRLLGSKNDAAAA
jgi:histidine ammonia-lyase